MVRTVMRKAVSILVVVAMITALSLPALGAESRERLTHEDSLYGYTFTENYISDEKLELYSYYEGELQKKFTIEAGNPLIYVDVFTGPSTRNGSSASSYTIPSASVESNSIVPYAERWGVLGYINYDENPGLGYVRGYTSINGNAGDSRLSLSAKKGTALDDVVATLSSFLIGQGISKILIAAGIVVSTWQSSLILAIITRLGIAVLDGIVQEAFTENVNTLVTSWDFRVTSFADKDSADGITCYLYDQGQTVTAMIGDSTDEWDTVNNGITFDTWQSNTLAYLAWTEMLPIYEYPGVINFTRN